MWANEFLESLEHFVPSGSPVRETCCCRKGIEGKVQLNLGLELRMVTTEGVLGTSIVSKSLLLGWSILCLADGCAHYYFFDHSNCNSASLLWALVAGACTVWCRQLQLPIVWSYLLVLEGLRLCTLEGSWNYFVEVERDFKLEPI